MGTSSDSRAVLIAGKKVTLTSLSKPIWEKQGIEKAHYLSYLAAISPYFLPFLQNRLLTVIRYPHGASGSAFFKNIARITPRILSKQIVPAPGWSVLICRRLFGWAISWHSNFIFPFKRSAASLQVKSSLILIRPQETIFRSLLKQA
ncbi:hypothetical protein QS257_15230 [Terrilactibacillus sp. S3-3]|nr:hypothetical protein QS257_15230 [Terrilactibacillus sp. S3-3]